jgi:hypothetical protein
VLLLLGLLSPAALAHEGCGRAAVHEREAAAVARSLFVNAVERAKEAARPAPAAPPPPLPPPAAPRIWLDYQLAGYADDEIERAHIVSDTMPTAVRVLQKLFKARRRAPSGC